MLHLCLHSTLPDSEPRIILRRDASSTAGVACAADFFPAGRVSSEPCTSLLARRTKIRTATSCRLGPHPVIDLCFCAALFSPARLVFAGDRPLWAQQCGDEERGEERRAEEGRGREYKSGQFFSVRRLGVWSFIVWF